MSKRDKTGERDYADDSYYDTSEPAELSSAAVGIIVGVLFAFLVMVSFTATCWWINCPAPIEIGGSKPEHAK
jgi:hypothetical protein